MSGQIIINYEFENSHGQIIYLGEWHTHPECSPSPSQRDLSMIREQFKLTSLNTNFVLLLIQGFEVLDVGVLDKRGFVSRLITYPVHPQL
ncbi:Mov34/MPN/PAD-1 family protein [Dyadobacter sp. 676]|uniref:Mov34/MPN/PAD-1 family protein n=1 Tax=Dyadobacter sp. 676 TaxID=3088362 RepID=A0AAU8FU14_9BACT